MINYGGPRIGRGQRPTDWHQRRRRHLEADKYTSGAASTPVSRQRSIAVLMKPTPVDSTDVPQAKKSYVQQRVARMRKEWTLQPRPTSEHAAAWTPLTSEFTVHRINE